MRKRINTRPVMRWGGGQENRREQVTSLYHPKKPKVQTLPIPHRVGKDFWVLPNSRWLFNGAPLFFHPPEMVGREEALGELDPPGLAGGVEGSVFCLGLGRSLVDGFGLWRHYCSRSFSLCFFLGGGRRRSECPGGLGI